jgi:hypothetical protein
MHAARPDLPPTTLRAALLSSTKPTNALSALLGNGRLDTAAAMHTILPASAWHTTTPTTTTAAAAAAAAAAKTAAKTAATPTLRLHNPRTAHTHTPIKLRWSTTNTPTITRWTITLDTHHIRTTRPTTTTITTHITTTGKHTWRVTGYHNTTTIITAHRTIHTTARH